MRCTWQSLQPVARRGGPSEQDQDLGIPAPHPLFGFGSFRDRMHLGTSALQSDFDGNGWSIAVSLRTHQQKNSWVMRRGSVVWQLCPHLSAHRRPQHMHVHTNTIQ